jgi:hypothetical protein
MTARTDDYDEIVRVVRLYVDGFNDNDVSKFKEAFHEDAWIFYIDPKGVLRHSGRRRRVGANQLRPRVGQIQRLDRLPQPAPDQRRLEDHQQDRDSQQPLGPSSRRHCQSSIKPTCK